MAFVLIQHLDPMHASHTAELLASHTNLPVVEASDGMAVEPNHVYVIPPGAYLSMSGNVLRLSEPAERRGVRVPIDFFFRSLAEDQQERAICVILSGTGSDGTLGLREVKAAGGIVLAQDPSTSPFDGMPRSAVSTGLVDYVLPPEQMSGVLTRYIRHWYVNGDTPPAAEQNRDDFNTILAVLRSRIKYDFSCYKKGTLWRRVQRRMGLRHIESLAEYAGVLRANSDEATALFKDLLIGVTNFFREPEAWSTLRDKVIRPLVARVGQAVGGAEADQRGPLRVWIPACASGEEAYTMAMLVIEEMQHEPECADFRLGHRP
jgi:two-component system CheB/CheR fusion protein